MILASHTTYGSCCALCRHVAYIRSLVEAPAAQPWPCWFGGIGESPVNLLGAMLMHYAPRGLA